MDTQKNKKSRVVISLASLIIVFIFGFSFGKASNSSSEASIFGIFSRLFGGGQVAVAGDVSVVSVETSDDATIILGMTRATVGAFMFTAIEDAMSVKEMQILLSHLNNPNNPSEEAQDEIPRIYLYDGNDLIGSSNGYLVSPSGNLAGIAFVKNLNWVLPKNSSKVLTVKGDVNRVGEGGETWADTGASVYSHIMSGGFRACMMSRNSNCDTVITPASSAQRLVYKSKPVLSMISYNGVLQAGYKIPAFKFRIAASDVGQIEWSKVQFYVTMTGATMYAVNSQTTALDDITNGINDIYLENMFSADAVSSSQRLPIVGGRNGYVTLTLANPERIQAGQYKDYLLRLGFGNLVQSPGAAASISLNRAETGVKNAMSQWGIEVPIYDGVPSLIWSDYSAASHSTSTLDWANGLYAKTFGDVNTIHN